MLDGTKNRPRARCSRAYVLKWLIGGSAWKFESVALPAWTTASSDVAITGVWIDLNQNWDLSAAHKQVPAEMAMCPSWIHNGWTVQQHRNCWGIQSSKGSLPAYATRQSRQRDPGSRPYTQNWFKMDTGWGYRRCWVKPAFQGNLWCHSARPSQWPSASRHD